MSSIIIIKNLLSVTLILVILMDNSISRSKATNVGYLFITKQPYELTVSRK